MFPVRHVLIAVCMNCVEARLSVSRGVKKSYRYLVAYIKRHEGPAITSISPRYFLVTHRPPLPGYTGEYLVGNTYPCFCSAIVPPELPYREDKQGAGRKHLFATATATVTITITRS